jgi:hypothetical protein
VIGFLSKNSFLIGFMDSIGFNNFFIYNFFSKINTYKQKKLTKYQSNWKKNQNKLHCSINNQSNIK